MTDPRELHLRRFSSRRKSLHESFLSERLRGARAYDRIAGYFNSSLLEIAGEALESVQGRIRVVCNSDLDRRDVETARAAQMALRRSWCVGEPERLLEGSGEAIARERFRRLFEFLKSGKLEVRVLPDHAFGLIHGKAGVITLPDGSKNCFLGSANESRAAWEMNYELLWEDPSPEGVAWVEEEFEALWGSPYAVPLADFIIQDLGRLAERRVIRYVEDWAPRVPARVIDAAPPIIETPVYRREGGLWEHQKYFVKLAFETHGGPTGKARLVLADQVGLGKTLQLAMTALLIVLTGEKPILVLCPKTLIWQWQAEMRNLLDMPSAVWNGRQWVDERGIEYPSLGPEAICKCPRRVGIVSTGLITRRSEAAEHLLRIEFDCVILDEAHRARRKNLGPGRDGEIPDPNNLLKFMYNLADKTRSLLLATATPVQLRPVEAWDLLDILNRGDESVLGNMYSRWRRPDKALPLIMGEEKLPESVEEQWDWLRNPMPPKEEHRDFEVLRSRLGVPDGQAVIPGDAFTRLGEPERARIRGIFPRLIPEHNPFIRKIIRRTREQLEKEIDHETGEPLLQPIKVQLFGEDERDAVLLPPYLREAYGIAEDFCQQLAARMGGSGFLKTLLLRRVGSTIYAGRKTAQMILDSWETIQSEEIEEEDTPEDEEVATKLSRTLTPREHFLLERFVSALDANQERDPKYGVVVECLRDRAWLEIGCIVFSQYRDSIQWLAEHLTKEFPNEPIVVYSGSTTSGVMQEGEWVTKPREELKGLVMSGRVRLMLGTDSASEGLNLQRLATLINLDLPWNPTRLEQRKGRIQRIGQVHDTVKIYNMRYKDSVEDRVHELLSERFRDIYNMFGQLPDVLEDAWVALAVGEKEQAKKVIDAVPRRHPMEIRYTAVEKVEWESCREVLDKAAMLDTLSRGW